MSTEKLTQKAVLDYLEYKRYFYWRNNSGVLFSEYKGKTRMVRYGAVGSPDIFVLHKGILYGLEVKDINGKQSPGQVSFEENMKRAGGIYKVVKTIDDVIALGL